MVPALPSRALRGLVDLSSAGFPPAVRRSHPGLLRGPVACRCVPGPQAGPAAFCRGWQRRKPQAGPGAIPEGPWHLAPRRQGREPCLRPTCLQPAAPCAYKLSLALKGQKHVASTGSLGPAPGASPAPVGADPLRPDSAPPAPQQPGTEGGTWRGGQLPSGLKHRFLLGAAVHGLSNTQTV